MSSYGAINIFCFFPTTFCISFQFDELLCLHSSHSCKRLGQNILDLDIVHQLKVRGYSWAGFLLDTLRFLRIFVDKKTISKVQGSVNNKRQVLDSPSSRC
jgi:hypothetical protein